MENEITKDEALKVMSCLKSEGWQVLMEKVLKPMVEALDSVKGLTSVRDMQSQQKCLRFAENFVNTAIDISQQVDAEFNDSQIATMTDGIIRVAK